MRNGGPVRVITSHKASDLLGQVLKSGAEAVSPPSYVITGCLICSQMTHSASGTGSRQGLFICDLA